MLRRRLDRHGRMALATAWPCAEGLSSVPLVFASRHGDLDRTLELLSALAEGETLSPTAFSLSVHNSTAGLFSIARSDRAAATAVAAGADTLSMGLMEAANLIADGKDAVLFCYADDMPPPAYQPYLKDDAARHPFSISLLLTPAGDAGLECRLARHDGASEEAPETALVRFLVEGTPDGVLGVGQAWRIERVAHVQ